MLLKINGLVGGVFALIVLAKTFFVVGPAVVDTSVGMLGASASRSSEQHGSVNITGKEANVKKYGLKGEEIKSFDLCQQLLPKSGKAPGDLGTYCGCLSKRATDEFARGNKTTAILLVNEFRKRGRLTIAEVNDIVSEDSVNVTRSHAAKLVVEAMTSCREEAINVAATQRSAG